MKAVIELAGSLGAGKTSVALALGEALAPAPILYIDASPDQKLTTALAPKPPELTLGRLLSQNMDGVGSREAVDWAFHDLTVPVGHEQELMTVGHFPATIEPLAESKLHYGLTRLIENYDYVVIDGHHAVLQRLMPEEPLRVLDIVTPEDFTQWVLPVEREYVHTPALILNRYSDEALPASLETALQTHQIQLIGKLPRYQNPEDRLRQFSDAFADCLLRLNIPLSLNP